ncbi:hypothetical protein DFH09DRAFT_1131946 [Mycena vulgaris]|nr:hypothetical protein DFH09DRAFT_1131946 [Mycena vulgaris]
MQDMMPVPMDIDHDTLRTLENRCKDPYTNRDLPQALVTILTREMKQTKARLTMWKNYTSSNFHFAEAVFASYPSSRCSTDPELFGIMADRGCTVFDFGFNRTASLIQPDKIKNSPVSLLRCPAQWLPEFTALAQSNPNILAIDLPNSVAGEIQATLQERRSKWGIVGPTGVDSFFCFAAGIPVQRFSFGQDGAGRSITSDLLAL